jgi:hypothetical protein
MLSPRPLRLKRQKNRKVEAARTKFFHSSLQCKNAENAESRPKGMHPSGVKTLQKTLLFGDWKTVGNAISAFFAANPLAPRSEVRCAMGESARELKQNISEEMRYR